MLAWPVTTSAQAGAGPSTGQPAAALTRDSRRSATVRAIHLSEPLRVDGQLDEAVYRSMPAISDFLQTLPKENAEPTERTEAWVMFDDATIYVAARLWESVPPEHWTANEMRRDTNQLRQNDHFGVAFDTFHDGRNGYFFYANPLGARADSHMTDETNNNADWNPVWDARTGRFEHGWTLEMAIPFKSLRYVSGAGQTWGINMRRAIRRKNEWNYLNPLPLSIGGSVGMMRVSADAALVGLDLPPASRNIELKPYAIARSTTDVRLNPPVSNALGHDFGGDAKYGITANLTADVTVNTDFAQVEIDEQQVNLTRFNLLFPEKREFFLEGRGIFDFGRAGSSGATADTPALFYSRRIGLNQSRVVPIDLGSRLTGKVGGLTIGALNVQTGDEAVSQTPATNFTVLRVKRDIFRRSTIGAMFTNRSHSTRTDGSNQAFGGDAAFSFFQDLTLDGYAARTVTTGLDGDDTSYQGRMNYDADRYGARAEYLSVGEHFNPEVGFLRRTGFRRSFGDLRFSPRPRAIRGVRQLTYEGSLEYVESAAGVLESRQQTAHFNVEFENSDQFSVDAGRNYEHLDRPFEVSSGVNIPVGGYAFDDTTLRYLFGQQRRASGAVAVQLGQFYDGTIRAVTISGARVSVTHQLSVEPSLSINHIDVSAGAFTTTVLRSRADFGFTPRMFVGGLVQYGSAEHAFTSNLRLRWEYRPGSELFIVYTDERDTALPGFPDLKNRAFVIKINRLWRW